MSKTPSLTGKALISTLKKFGFEVIRVKGSHHFLRHYDGRSTTIPLHSGEEIGPGLITKILKDCEISIDDIRKFI